MAPAAPGDGAGHRSRQQRPQHGSLLLGGSSGDALHAMLCAAGFNIRWLLRATAAEGRAALLLVFSQIALHAARIGKGLRMPALATGRTVRQLGCRRWPATSRLATE